MSIKKDNVSVTAVIYNNQDVNKVILDNNCVWCRPFTYTQGALPTGVESLTCTRSSTDEPTSSTGKISNGDTIYYYDKLYWDATASAGYRITAVRGSGSPVTVSGAITGTTASGVTSERISGTISQGKLPAEVASITCYRKAYNENSFSEYTGSTIYYGDQFYWTATAATEYNSPSLTYNNSSKVYTWTGSQNGSIDSVSASGLSAGTRRSFTISFGTTANKSLYGSWSSSSQTAYYGDKITVSGTTVTCYKWDNISTARWTVKVSASSNTAEYTYSAVTIAESNIASVTAEAAFTAYNTRTLNSYTITWKYLSAYPDTWATATESYNYGATPSRANPSTVTSGSARKVFVRWDNLNTVTGNRTITAVYATQFAPTIKSNYCTANRSSGTWYDSGTVITWTANDNYSFGGTAVKDTTTQTITSGGTYSATPGYIKCTISCTRCTSAPATGSIIQVGKSITYTANSNYSYTEHATTASNPPEHTVALGTTSYSRSCDYAYITVSGTNCSANVANGYRKIGNSITWTANTNYAFDSSGKTTVSQTIESSGNYNKDATHGWYIVNTKNCTANVSTNWYPVTSSKSTTFTANDGWSFGGSTVKDTTTASAAVPGSVTAEPTNFYITVQNGTGCSADVSSGMKSTSNPPTITWTVSNGYAFNSSGKTTDSQKATGPGTYKKDATHGYYTLSLTNCSYSSGNNAGWYTLGSKPSTTVQANNDWSFGGSSRDTTTIGGSATVPTTVSASPAYFYLTFTPTNCRCSSNSGYYTSSTKPSSVTWTPNDYYSFDAGSKQTNTTTTISSNSPNTYSASPQYVRANSIATGTYNASANRDASTYYAANTVVTWTAKTNYYYDASGTTTSTNNNTKITAGATISAPNPTHIKCTISGTNCQADKSNGSILPVGETITWTGNTGTNSKYGFSNTNSSSTTDTATVALGTTSYSKTASYLWYNVTSVTGTHCSAYNSNSYTQGFSTGWHLAGTKIYWKTTEAPYAMTTSNETTWSTEIQPGNNDRSAVVKRYTLTISVTNGSYGTYSVTRDSSQYQGAGTGALSNGATIYYGDVLKGTSSAKAASYDGWNIDSVTAPTATTTGDATSGNLTIINNSSYSANLYYNTSNAAGGTLAGTVAANGSKTVTGLSFNTQYYISARVDRTRTKHTYATDGDQYSGTNGVTGNVTATFKFKDTTSTDTGTIYSSAVSAKTAAQNQYTVTFSTTSGRYGSWGTTSISNVPYGTTITRNGNTVTVGNAGSSTFAPASTTAQYNYAAPTFNVPSSVTGATTVTGGCERSDRLYTIQWIGENGSTVLETDSNVKYGAVLTYNGSTPSKPSTAQYSYAFSAWKLGSTSGSTVTSGSTTNAGSTSSTTINIYSTFTSTVRSYTITWKYMSAYDSWTTATESYNYGATPSRSLPSTVTGTNKRYVSLNWDDLGQVTGNRTITCNYKHQISYTYTTNNCKYSSGTKSGWYDGTSLSYSTTFTSNSGYAFDSSGTTTKTYSGTTSGGSITVSAAYINITARSSNITCSLGYNPNDTSGNASIWVTSGTQVYAFAKLNSFVSSVPNTWTLKYGSELCPGAIYITSSSTYTKPTTLTYSADITTNSFWCAHRITSWDGYSTSQTFNAARWNGSYYSVNNSFNVFTTHGLQMSSRWSGSGTYPYYHNFNINGPSSVSFKAEYALSMSGETYETPTFVLYRVSTDGTMARSVMSANSTKDLTTGYLWVLTIERPEGTSTTPDPGPGTDTATT